MHDIFFLDFFCARIFFWFLPNPPLKYLMVRPLSLFCKNYRFSKTVLIIHGCLEIPDLFLVLNMISHSFTDAALTREISCSCNSRNKFGISAHPCIILFCLYTRSTRELLTKISMKYIENSEERIVHH